jgi:tRNA(fMet)-specific endonuclease VapC
LARASGRFLLDTNSIIPLLEGDEPPVRRLSKTPEVFLPAVVLGELFFGAAEASRHAENMARIERFAAGRTTVPCDLEVAREYGRLKYRLRQKRRPLPQNDVSIAATALRHNMVLVARDCHFSEIEGLLVTDRAVQP